MINERHGSSQEIFVPAATVEDINKINELNDPMSRAKKRSREKIIEAKGIVTELDFVDVKRDLQMTAQREFNDRVKGRNNG